MDHPLFGFHPNQTYVPNTEQHMGNEDGVVHDIYGAIDNSPKCVAGLVLGSVLTLVALKALGFRFSFGVAAGR